MVLHVSFRLWRLLLPLIAGKVLCYLLTFTWLVHGQSLTGVGRMCGKTVKSSYFQVVSSQFLMKAFGMNYGFISTSKKYT